MRTSVLTGLVLAGCSFHSSKAPADGQDIGMIDGARDTEEIDAPVDAPPDAPRQDFGTGVWTIHVPTLPTGGVMLPATIMTDSSALCSADAAFTDPSQPAACVIVGTTIAMGGDTTVRGNKPLVLVATDSLTIDHKLDIAAHRGQALPGGGNWSGCGSPTSGADRSMGAGGGAGGSFITVGGTGGTGDNGNGLAGAPAPSLSAPALLHGGCPGSHGGDGSQNAAGIANGGGAIYIVAANAITVSGMINASGSGAVGGGHTSGGSGGGSGGTIILDAPAVDASGLLLANGGGGSGGGDNNSNGNNGSDEMIAMPLVTPPGGMGPGGAGGGGSTNGTAGTGAGSGNGMQGGGGGGGGAGFIGINVAVTGGTYTPSPAMFP